MRRVPRTVWGSTIPTGFQPVRENNTLHSRSVLPGLRLAPRSQFERTGAAPYRHLVAPAARHPELERTMDRVKTRRTIQALTVILAAALLAGAGFAAVYLRSYLIARCRGESADLHNCILVLAPLSGADLASANLRHAHLSGSDSAAPTWTTRTLRLPICRGRNWSGLRWRAPR
jgi:uncharacterized protein YjbI with pentapeptide repeats